MAVDNCLLLRPRQLRPRPAVRGRPVTARQLIHQLRDRPGSAFVDVVPGLEDLGEDPLGPAIVRRIGRGDAAARVVGQTQPAELAAVVGDIGLSGGPRVLPPLHRVLLRRQAERIETKSVQDIPPGHPVVAAIHIGANVTERMPDMQPIRRRVREHVQQIELRPVAEADTAEKRSDRVRRRKGALALRRLGLAHDPRRSVATTDPAYYRWTQWIFAQIFEAWYDVDAGRARPIAELVDELASGNRPTPDGRAWADLSGAEQQAVVDGHRLAYLADGPVNWCPGLGTVLANEEVTADGRSDIGNFPVFRRTMRQWMLRITAYADRLLDDLNSLAWPESIKTMQRNWIGRSDGARIRFSTSAGPIEVFTTRPDTVFGATFMVLAPEHPLVELLLPPIWPPDIPQSWRGGANRPAEAAAEYRHAAASKTDRERQESRVKTGVVTGAVATNPATGASIPVFIADYVLMGYGTGAIMGVPGQDERDWEFAEAYDLPIVRTVRPPEGSRGGHTPETAQQSTPASSMGSTSPR